MERGKLPEISPPAWPQPATARLTNHPLPNRGFLELPIRSNYLFEESAGIYEFSLKLWEGLSRELNFNTMFSQRGVLAVVQDRAGMNEIRRRAAAIELAGIDVEILSPAGVKAWCPILDMASGTRHPILGGLLQRRGGVARHDALAWGFARAADARGVDIIQNCEVTALRRGRSGITGIETTRGAIKAGKVAICVAGHSSKLAAMAGLRLPIETHPLQALVSEPIKPVLNTMACTLQFVFVGTLTVL